VDVPSPGTGAAEDGGDVVADPRLEAIKSSRGRPRVAVSEVPVDVVRHTGADYIDLDRTWGDRGYLRGGYLFCADPDCKTCHDAITVRIAAEPIPGDHQSLKGCLGR
jgi:hypothetical protein